MSKTELSNKNRKDNAVTTKVNHTNTKKSEYDGALLGHSRGAAEEDKANFSGKDSRVKLHQSSGPDVGATVHSQAPSVGGASPNRVRFSEPKLIRKPSDASGAIPAGTVRTWTR
jgi:hypothetical protein